MSDLVDLAQAHNAPLEAACLKVRKQAAPMPTGLCLNCGELVTEGLRWCDPDCRDDWELRQRRGNGLAGDNCLADGDVSPPFPKGIPR